MHRSQPPERWDYRGEPPHLSSNLFCDFVPWTLSSFCSLFRHWPVSGFCFPVLSLASLWCSRATKTLGMLLIITLSVQKRGQICKWVSQGHRTRECWSGDWQLGLPVGSDLSCYATLASYIWWSRFHWQILTMCLLFMIKSNFMSCKTHMYNIF